MRKADYRWGVLVVLLAVLGALGGFALSRRQHPYSATAALVFRTSNLEQSLLGNAAPASNETSEDQATQVLLVNRPPVIAAAIRKLGLRESVGSVQSRVSAASAGASNVVEVSAKAPTAAAAEALANAVATQFVALQTANTRAAIAAAERGLSTRLSKLQAQPRNATTLGAEQSVQTQPASLAALGAVNPANVSVIQRATGAGRTGHSRNSLIALGVIVGLIVGLILFWLAVQLRRQRQATLDADMHGFADQTYLALSRAGRRTADDRALPAADLARVDHLAVVLDLEPGDEQRLVLCAPVDSANRFDLAWRLAQAAAGLGARTLYVTISGEFRDTDAGLAGSPKSLGTNLSTLAVPTVGADLNERLRAMVEHDGRPFDAIVVAGSSLADDATSLRLAARADSVVLFSVAQSPVASIVEGSLHALGRVGAPRPGFVSVGARPA